MACEETSGCKSIDWNFAEDKCFLNDASKEDVALANYQNIDYYKMTCLQG